MATEDYYDRILYVKNRRYSFFRMGRVAEASDEKRKKIVDALEDERVRGVFSSHFYWGDIKILYKDGTVEYS